jgi:hypothetical protein
MLPMITFVCPNSSNLSQNTNLFAKLFGENIFKIITLDAILGFICLQACPWSVSARDLFIFFVYFLIGHPKIYIQRYK